MNPVDRMNDWQVLRAVLIADDLAVDEHPSELSRALFDEALALARLKCGEEL
jgi:hypothetical protein